MVLCTALPFNEIYLPIKFQVDISYTRSFELCSGQKCDADADGQSDPKVSALLQRRHKNHLLPLGHNPTRQKILNVLMKNGTTTNFTIMLLQTSI